MKQLLCHCATLLLLCQTLPAAEILLHPGETPIDAAPEGFTSVVGGDGPPGDWRTVMDTLPSAMVQISPLARNNNRQKVIGQVSQTSSTSRQPMLIFEDEEFDDFTLSSRLKAVGGERAQIFGIVFRWQDAQNYYSCQLDALGGWFYFRKVVNGQAQEPIGNRIPIKTNEWHLLEIQCQGPKITLRLNDSHRIPVLTDTQFTTGKIGFWTGADTRAHFGDTKVDFRPKILAAQRVVDQIMKKYNRLIQVSLYSQEDDDIPAKLIASNQAELIGNAADEAALDSIARGKIYYKRTKKTAIVTLPIKDRNGEVMAACRVELKRFRGQTQQNAIVRAMPVLDMIKGRILDREDFFE